MKFSILTIFPEIFSGFLNSSLVSKAISSSAISVSITNIRDFTKDPHKQVDDVPYGGGAGMLMKPQPLIAAIRKAKEALPAAKVILLSASGELLTQAKCRDFSKHEELILVCGRYEGVDQRVIDHFVDYEVSIGNYVLMGGEVPAMVLIEGISRLVSNVIGNIESTEHESFSIEHEGELLLESPQYTRPAEYEGMKVPEVLLSGDHNKIKQWRIEQSKIRTTKKRPDLNERK